MSGEDRLRWDQVYRKRESDTFPPPDSLLFDFTPPVPPDNERRALDLAGGVGQNGLWLAAQGYTVDILDISRVALLRAQTEMTARQLRSVNLYAVDLDRHEFPANHYDLVCIFRYLKRDLFTALRSTVKPGGRIIYETFNRRYLKIVPGFNPAFLLDPGELAGYFSDWKILNHVESSHISRLVAAKP